MNVGLYRNILVIKERGTVMGESEIRNMIEIWRPKSALYSPIVVELCNVENNILEHRKHTGNQLVGNLPITFVSVCIGNDSSSAIDKILDALYWIKSNSKFLKGNSNNITIIGSADLEKSIIELLCCQQVNNIVNKVILPCASNYINKEIVEKIGNYKGSIIIGGNKIQYANYVLTNKVVQAGGKVWEYSFDYMPYVKGLDYLLLWNEADKSDVAGKEELIRTCPMGMTIFNIYINYIIHGNPNGTSGQKWHYIDEKHQDLLHINVVNYIGVRGGL